MSARNTPLTLAPRARRDFTNLLLHSQRMWGKDQREAYKTAIDDALQSIARFPEIGASRPDLGFGLRSLTVKQHVVFYRIEDRGVRIDRILHVHMDAAAHLDR